MENAINCFEEVPGPVVPPPSLLRHGFHRVRRRAPGLLRGLKSIALGELLIRLAHKLTAYAHVRFRFAISAVYLPSQTKPLTLHLFNYTVKSLYTVPDLS